MAQNASLSFEPLADPPWVTHFIFESPHELGSVLGVVAVVLLLFVRYRDWGSGLPWAGGCLLGCVGVFGLSFLIETDREEIARYTEELVQLTVPLDLSTMETFFDPDATLNGPSGEAWLNLDQILTEVRRVDAEWPMIEQTVVRLRSETNSDRTGRTMLTLRTKIESTDWGDRAFRTLWLIQWSKRGNNDRTNDQANDRPWVVSQVQWLTDPEPLALNPPTRWRR